jgi:hypothetical protein
MVFHLGRLQPYLQILDLAGGKSSLLDPFVSYKQNKVLRMQPPTLPSNVILPRKELFYSDKRASLLHQGI